MLIYSQERFYPADTNIMILQDADNFYYYVHRSLYDQAVILNYLYGGDIHALSTQLEVEVTETSDDLVQILPEPLGILSAFLYFAPELEEIADCCGVLHMLSSYINLLKFTQVPSELRSTLKLNLSDLSNYHLYWDRFFIESRAVMESDYIPPEPKMIVPTTDDEYIDKNSPDMQTEFMKAMMDEKYDNFDWGITSNLGGEEEPKKEEEEEKEPVKPAGLLAGL